MKMLLFILVVLVGCKDPLAPQSIENAAAVAQYEAMLADCRAQGERTHNYEVYAACADAVDHKLCTENGLRCADGGK